MSLHAGLSTTIENGTARFELTVTNNGTDPVELDYPDTGKAEFVVRADNGDSTERWRYSDGRAAAQVLTSDRLDPNGSITYEGRWARADPGEYVVQGSLRVVNRSLDATDAFVVER